MMKDKKTPNIFDSNLGHSGMQNQNHASALSENQPLLNSEIKILDYTKNSNETFRTISDDLSESLKSPELYAQKQEARANLLNVFNTSTEENLASSIEIQGIPLDKS